MSTQNAAVEATLQKIFVLCAGMPADTQVAASLAQQVVDSGSWASVKVLLDGYLAAQASAMGGNAALLKLMALQGFGFVLSDADANGLAAQIASGATTWGALALQVVDIGGPLGDTLTHKADAAAVFTAALVAQGKGGLYFGGAQLLGGVREVLLGVTAQEGTVAEAKASLQALVDHLGSGGIAVTATDGYLNGASVFVDSNGNGRLDGAEQVLETDEGGNVDVSTAASGGSLVAFGGVDLLTGCDFEGVISAPMGATVITPLTTLIDALLRIDAVGSAQAGSTLVEQAFGLPASLNLLNFDPLAVLANPLASPADKAAALDAQALSLQVINVITLGGLELSSVGGIGVQAASRLMADALAHAMAAGTPLDLGDPATVKAIIDSALQALTGHAPTAQQSQDTAQIAQLAATLNDQADGAANIYKLAQVACVSQCDAVDAVRDALAGGHGLQGVLDAFSGQRLEAAILTADVGEIAPGVPLIEAVTPIQTVGIRSVADDHGTPSTADDTVVPRGGTSGDTTPIVNGHISAPLQAGEVVVIYGGPNGDIPLGAATVVGQDFSFVVGSPLSGDQLFVARVVNFYAEGPASDGYPVTLNHPPEITSDGGGASASVSVAENGTAVTTVTAFDADGNSLAYSIAGGADAALFTIDASTGALSFITAPDYENPVGGDNSFNVTVQVSDGVATDTQDLFVTVTSVNEAPVITSNAGGASAYVSVAENTTAVGTVTATDVDGDSLAYSIAGGADAARFTIDASTGALSFITAPNYEAPADAGCNNVYDVTVQVSDGTLTDTQDISVAVFNVNEAPVITSNGGGASANVNVAENSTAVTTVTATDPEGGGVYYSIVGGADSARFTINLNSGALSFITAPDFESPADAGGNNVYDVTVQAYDLTLTDTQNIAVTVTNLNEAPVITSNGGGASAGVSVAENTTAVTTVTATDMDGNSLTYSISGGSDSALFTINSSTGALSFITAPNYESPVGCDNNYDVTVRVSDGTLTDTQAIFVSVTNVNEAPVITSNGGGASASVSVAENGTAVTTVTATDVDGNSLTYSISGGSDSALFTINASTGALSFITAPNYESPVGCDNNYDVTVRVSDGTLTDTQQLFVSVTNVNEAPVITSNAGGPSANVSVAENTTAVTTVTATDVDGNSLTYSITGGTNSSLFTINATTGALSFITAPDYENPLACGNSYDVIVAVSDGTLTDTQDIHVSVTNANDAPVITSNGGGASAAVSVAENSTAVTTVTGTDQDGASLMYTITGGADSALFTIDINTGALSFITAPDYESPIGGDNSYAVTVQASDGTLADTQSIVVSVTNVNEAPVITSNSGGASAYVSIAENTTAVTTVTATDVDGNSLTYSITGGFNSSLFTINATTGALSFITAPDYENPLACGNSYDVIVSVSDGTLTDTQDIHVSVYNVNEAPVITSNSGGASAFVSVAEGTSAVTTVTATDVDGNSLSYSIAGGADSALFTINTSTGALSFITAPDYEAPVGGDNSYDVTVQASDGTLTDTQALVVTVTNVNEAPVITSNAGGASAFVSIAENTTAVTTVTATDVDGNSLTYSIAGGTNSSLFTIDSSTGALSFITAPDYENPQACGNSYDVVVAVSDGTLSDTQDIHVSVYNVNEAPVITSNGGGASANVSVAEGGATVTTVTATDVDGNSVAYSITGGADSALFTINASTGALSFVTAPNYESPLDSGSDNGYEVTVQASDGTLTDTQSIFVSVTNVNEAPVITSNAGGASANVTVAENTTAVTTVTATDVDGNSLAYSITGGFNSSLFTINASTGALSFITAPDYENPQACGNVYDVIVSVSDGTLSDTQDIHVSVANANDAPAITSNGGGTTAAIGVSENTAAVTTVTATDPEGNSLAYSIAGGADSALFTINASTGALSFISAPNFESPADGGADNVYDVTVQVSDGTLADTQAIAVTVSNANEAPVISSNGGGATAAVTIAENTTAVATVAASDVDGNSVAYSITGGADSALFTINASTGALSFISAPNFESPTDGGANNVYDVIVQASDGTLADTQAIAVTVSNANEAPVITSGGGGTSAVIGMIENSTAAGTIAATDPDGNSVTYSITGGPDAALFTINPTTGALSFATAPNYEAPADTGADNTYTLTVQASDGTLTDSQALAITVSNQNEAPVITSNSGGATAAVTIAENTSSVTTVAATDVDGNTVAYSISGGADSAKFTINASTGALSFITAPDFESPTDAGANNIYDVTVQASDGTLTDTQDIAVTVSNAAEGPTALGDTLYYSAASAATAVTVPRTGLFSNDSGSTAKSTWSLTNITNTGGGGTATLSSGDISLTGFDTVTADTFTYQAVDAGGTSASATVTVLRVATANITGSSGSDIIVGGNTAAALAGSGGNDFILGGTGNDTLTGGTGADDLTGGVGADRYAFAENSDGVGPTAVNYAAGTAGTIDNGDTFTFGNGVDIVRGFVSASDTLDLAQSGSLFALSGAASNSSLNPNRNYSLRGDYNEVTKVFTANSTSGADLLVVQGDNSISPDNFVASETDFIVLIGTTSIVAGDII
ncbi:MAG: cadherin domain-containing protein [Pseudomonadota bacterium]